MQTDQENIMWSILFYCLNDPAHFLQSAFIQDAPGYCYMTFVPLTCRNLISYGTLDSLNIF